MKITITVGIDMGDKLHTVCFLSNQGKVLQTLQVQSTAKALKELFAVDQSYLIALEAGTHSNWVSKLLEQLGHHVLVGNPRKLRMIWENKRKSDIRDAEMLARIARFDPALLYPIHHCSLSSQAKLAVLKSRNMLVQTRRSLIQHCRGIVKSMGGRIRSCGAETFHKHLRTDLPVELEAALLPMAQTIENLTMQIREYDAHIERISAKEFPETAVLRQIKGVGPLTALTFILTLEDPNRFRQSRTVGAYLGLVPRRAQSGEADAQLGITKNGNEYVRMLLMQCAHYILGPFGEDCDLRRFGLRIAARGGKNAKKRALVATARKLSVVLHCLWKTQATYIPLMQKLKKVA